MTIAEIPVTKHKLKTEEIERLGASYVGSYMLGLVSPNAMCRAEDILDIWTTLPEHEQDSFYRHMMDVAADYRRHGDTATAKRCEAMAEHFYSQLQM